MYKISKNIVRRKVHDTYFLINIADNYSDDKCVLYEINEIGNFIWNHIEDREDNIDKYIASLLVEKVEEDVDFSVIYNDVTNYISMLLKERFIAELQ